MLVPLSVKGKRNLCLSIVKLESSYSVAIVELVNGYGLCPIPSFRYRDETVPDEFDACIWLTGISFKGDNLYECIDKAMKYIESREGTSLV